MQTTSPTIGISIVSWRSWNTLERTLTSYRDNGLFDAVDKAVIYFQDLCDLDRAIAERFGIDYTGGPNCGIADGMRNAANHLNTDYVLFLENDCPLIESRDELLRQLHQAIDYIENGRIHVMRLRSRLYPGEGFSTIIKYLRYYRPENPEPEVDLAGLTNSLWKRLLRRAFKPWNRRRMTGRGIYVEKHPERLFPHTVERTSDGIFIGDSCCMDWTNQSALCKRTFFTETLMPYVDAHPCRRTSNGFQSPERPLNCRWWRRQHFKIGQGPGLFTHNRFDGSWRPTHPAFEGGAGTASSLCSIQTQPFSAEGDAKWAKDSPAVSRKRIAS